MTLNFWYFNHQADQGLLNGVIGPNFGSNHFTRHLFGIKTKQNTITVTK